ncbi:MAG TPA: M1 family metallopeptidase [Anaerolineales bacterium]
MVDWPKTTGVRPMLTAMAHEWHRALPILARLGLTAFILAGCNLTKAAPATIAPTLPPPTPTPIDPQAGMGDPYYPLLGNAGYDVTHYTIALSVDPGSNAVSGSTTIEANATQALQSFNLDLQGLSVDHVQVNGEAARFTSVEHELTVMPAQALAEGAAFEARVAYHGSPSTAQGASPESFDVVGWFHTPSGAINVMSEPNGAASWFPANDHPRDKATYRFEISVPNPWVVAANGSLRETKDNGDRRTYVWEMRQPMASYLATIDIDLYTIETEQGPDGVLIRNYLPADISPEWKANVSKLPEMISFLSAMYGPYPFDEYGIVVASKENQGCRAFGAMEAQSLSVHCPTDRMLSEWALVHELAHQWFGDEVSLENWKDMWLKEGMATYAEWMWEKRGAELSFLTSLARENASLNTFDTPIAEPLPEQLYDRESYDGGALVFHALRLQVGDENFFKILRTFLDRYRYGNAGTDEFMAVATEISGQDLASFFDAWLMKMPLPEIPKP